MNKESVKQLTVEDFQLNIDSPILWVLLTPSLPTQSPSISSLLRLSK